MVGPGTGIAPFRGFLLDRRATGATGKNWLFFGDRNAATDFLYRDEIEAFQRDGSLHRLDLAWSRDRDAKVYVQQRMLESASTLWSWLEEGAAFYVCGDASRMAKDVDAALHQVIQQAGARTPDQAAQYVDQLRATGRYSRDVY
jgi:sulfite reductase (NADPH) flavoprotein alpha-component